MIYTNKEKGFIAPRDIIVYYGSKGSRKKGEDFLNHSSDELKTLPESPRWEKVKGDLYELTNQIFISYPSQEAKEESLKAIIPEGTRFWIDENISRLYSERIKLTNEVYRGNDFSEEIKMYRDLGISEDLIENFKHQLKEYKIVSEKEKTDLSFLYEDLCLNLLTADGRKVSWSSEVNPRDIKGIYVNDDLVVGFDPIFSGSITFNPKSETLMTEYYEDALDDLTPMDTCSPNIINGLYSYIPTCGEMIKAFEKLTEINLTRLSLGLGILHTNTYFATRTFCNDSTVWGVYHENYKSLLKDLDNKRKHEILPFIKAI